MIKEGGEVGSVGNAKKLSFRFLKSWVKVEEIGLGLTADVSGGLRRRDEQGRVGGLSWLILIILSVAWLIIANNL